LELSPVIFSEQAHIDLVHFAVFVQIRPGIVNDEIVAAMYNLTHAGQSIGIQAADARISVLYKAHRIVSYVGFHRADTIALVFCIRLDGMAHQEGIDQHENHGREHRGEIRSLEQNAMECAQGTGVSELHFQKSPSLQKKIVAPGIIAGMNASSVLTDVNQSA
jgi:hypothetical protein